MVTAARYLLDTNAISEINKPQPNAGFMRWFDTCNEEQFYISCLTIGELEKGIALLGESSRRVQLEEYLNNVRQAFEAKVLDVDADSATIWGESTARLQRQGITLAVIDSLLAAQALAYGATVVTSNFKDFQPLVDSHGLKLFSPWS